MIFGRRKILEIFRELFDKNRPQKSNTFFYLYEVVQNFFFSSKVATTGKTHIRDRVDVQRVMVVVWLATFPAMFWGMYNMGYFGLDYLDKGGFQQRVIGITALFNLLAQTLQTICIGFGLVWFILFNLPYRIYYRYSM